MVPCLFHFPSVCLETIFKHVPLVDLLTSIGLVCTSWYNSRRTELMRRRRLVIVDDENDLKSFDRNFIDSLHGADLIGHVLGDDGSQWLTLESLERIKCNSLVVSRHRLTVQVTSSLMIMPKITHLALMLNDILNANLTQMIRLIEHLSDHLIDLKLHIDCSPPLAFDSDDEDFLGVNGRENETELAIGRNVTNLFACLERLQSLRHLRLFLVIPELDLRPQLSFLKRLITLSICVYGIKEDHFYWCLNRYCTNINSIDFHNMLNLDSNLPRLKPHLCSKFTYVSLSLDARFQDYENMALFCTRFSTLTKLKLNGCLMPMTTLARCLSRLPQLVHLDVYVINPQTEEAHPGEIAQVSSVRLLAIRFTTKSHNDSETLFISEIFPNVQVLRLDWNIRECPECAITDYGFLHHIQISEPELAGRLIRCKRLTRQPFRRCVNLHTVELASFGDQTVVITANEL